MGTVLPNGLEQPVPWPPVRTFDRVPVVPWYLSAKPRDILVGRERQLFVDDFLIQSSSMTRTWYQGTQSVSNPVLIKDQTWENFAMPFSGGVWLDSGTWKCIYLAQTDDSGNGGTLCYATSANGTSWTKPNLGIFGANNIVLRTAAGSIIDSNVFWLDLNDVPSRRYKLMVNVANPFPNWRLTLYVSSDAQHWNQVAQGPVMSSSNDRCTFYYAPSRAKWVLSLRDIVSPVGRCRRYRESDTFEGLVGFTLTTDLAPWWCSDTLDTLYPGSLKPFPELYNIDSVEYESVTLGLFAILSAEAGDAQPGRPKINQEFVGFSRDGFWYDRTNRVPLCPVDDNQLAWNNGNVQSIAPCLQVNGTQLYIYSSGRCNFAPSASMGLWTLRLDGFCSMDSGAGESDLRTSPFWVTDLTCSKMFVNVNAAGGVFRAEVQDERGYALPGFSKAACHPITSDSTDVQLTWAGYPSLQPYMEQGLRLAFFGTNSKLYSFRFSP